MDNNFKFKTRHVLIVQQSSSVVNSFVNSVEWLTCNWDMTKTFLPGKKRLLICSFCFDWPYNLMFDIIVHCTKSTCFVSSIIICICQQRLLQKSLGWSKTWKQKWTVIRVCGIHWGKGWIQHTQIKGKQCNFII